MGLKVSFPVGGRGNTVPYPPLTDDIRRNRGFVDLRGRPDLVSAIEETRDSPALCVLLEDLAQPHSRIITLGCDLGEHVERRRPLKWRRVAGGYVQIATVPLGEGGIPKLLEVARAAERLLGEDVGEDHWEVKFELCPVAFSFEKRVEAHSIWIWFFVAASTPERAKQARERLVLSLRRALRRSSYAGE